MENSECHPVPGGLRICTRTDQEHHDRYRLHRAEAMKAHPENTQRLLALRHQIGELETKLAQLREMARETESKLTGLACVHGSGW